MTKEKINTSLFYAVAQKTKEGFRICIDNRKKVTTHIIPLKTFTNKKFLNWLRNYAKENNGKIIAIGTSGFEKSEQLGSYLWLEGDMIPYLFSESHLVRCHNNLRFLTKKISKRFDNDGIPASRIGEIDENIGRVIVTEFLVSLEEYEKTTSKKDFFRMLELAYKCRKAKLKMAFFNSTPKGGGVAIMRHSLIRLFELLGVDIRWYVMDSDKTIFEITKKKFHDVLQGVYKEKLKITKKDIRKYNKWSHQNVKKYKHIFQKFNIIIIDDPQPSGMINHIKRINPCAFIIYRSHIQIRTDLLRKKDTIQSKAWDFLSQKINATDLFISHPIKQFIPSTIKKNKTILMPATTDLLDGLNKKLGEIDKQHYKQIFNNILTQGGQTPLDSNRPYIIQIARFDPSKGIFDVLDSYRQLRTKLQEKKTTPPQLVIIGNDSIDDPESSEIFNKVLLTLCSQEYFPFAHDIKVARIPFIDQLLNTLLTDAKITLQLSYNEGFEIKITESLLKGIPAIIYDGTGAVLQIKNKKNGFIIESGNVKEVTNKLELLITNEKLYTQMSKNAKKKINPKFLTINNAITWLSIAVDYVEAGICKKEKIKYEFLEKIGFR